MRRSRLLPCLLTALLLVVTLAAACGDDGGSTGDEGEGFNPPSTSEDGPPPRPTDGPAPDIDDLPEGAVVFSPDDVETDIFGNETTWTPTADDVEIVEEMLQAHIDENPELGLEDTDLGAYHRQYVGTGRVGDVVSVNALCVDADLDDWDEELVLVNDGGSCFWQAEVSFATLHVDTFTINGVA